jgi:hypothetical protein
VQLRAYVCQDPGQVAATSAACCCDSQLLECPWGRARARVRVRACSRIEVM